MTVKEEKPTVEGVLWAFSCLTGEGGDNESVRGSVRGSRSAGAMDGISEP